MMDDCNIIQAQKEDLKEILELQYLAYQSEAQLLGTKDIPPLKQTIQEIEDEFTNGIILKVELEKQIIGSVRMKYDKNTVYVGKLMVHPYYRRRGLGKKLLLEVESLYPNSRYELFTSTLSENNIKLYTSVGYKEFNRKKINDKVEFVYMEKTRK